MTKRIALAALLATGLAASLAAGAAQAQAPLTSGGSIVGGGLGAMLLGGGADAQVVYAQPGAGGGGMHLVQTGRLGRFAGSDGGSPKFEYGPPAATDAGREAWVTGGVRAEARGNTRRNRATALRARRNPGAMRGA